MVYMNMYNVYELSLFLKESWGKGGCVWGGGVNLLIINNYKVMESYE